MFLTSAVLLPLLAAGAIDVAFGVEVTVLAKVRSAEERAAWKASGWDARDGVAELYGIVEPPPGLRVIVWDRDRILRPAEDPALALLVVDRAAGEGVLPAQALWWRAALCALGVALLLVVGRLGLSRIAARSRAGTPRGADPGGA